ncbi:MAG: hypothetical protein JO185_13445 [Acidobacteriaceae bacterium]|nr:hypothetical protein [Acidobacteriaceae bacterium]MBV9937610.1 hypothetical protein [Acidobacteriaceae bacterium]
MPNRSELTHVGRYVLSFTLGGLLVSAFSWGQQSTPETPPAPGTIRPPEAPKRANPPEPVPKRIFGIVPNFRTFPRLLPYQPLTTPQKFKIASQDSFDRGTFVLAAAFAGEGQLTRSNPSFGSGATAYGRYLGTAYADFVIGDFMTEAIYPSLLRQDPRYFRRGQGSGLSRFGYAMGQLFWTRTDRGGTQFNYSEVCGNASAVALSNAYYPENRNAPDALIKLGTQLGVDMAANILKEFSPDLYHHFSRKHRSEHR